MYDIDKCIPVPKLPRHRKYPFGEMEIGDSFVDYNTPFATLCAAAHSYKRNNGKTFTTRRINDPLQGPGVRVWRVA